MHLHGPREHADLHHALFRGVLKATRVSASIERLTFLPQDIALIHTAGSGAKRERMDFGLRKSIQTLIVVNWMDTGEFARFKTRVFDRLVSG